MMSLSRYLTISLAISLVLFFFLQAGIVGIEMRKLAEDGVISRLEDDVEGILAALSKQEEQTTEISWEHVPDIFMRPFSGHYFQVHLANGDIRSRSLWDSELPKLEAGITRDVSGPEKQNLLVLTKAYVVHGRNLVISVAEDTSELEATARHIQQRLLYFSLGALMLLLVIQIWVIRHSLKSLSGVRKELQLLEQGKTDKLSLSVPAEIAPLVEEVNHLLLVLQQRLQRSRNAMGNLSHALKTPLTLIFQILERRLDDKDSNQLLAQAHQIESHINRELARARTAGVTPGGKWPNPAQDIRDLASTMVLVHQERVKIEVKALEFGNFTADREDMLELIGNLVDNACKWAKGRVVLHIRQQGGLLIEVEDDGPGMTEEERDLALGRGIRMDEAKPGHGLGLAIVREIVDVYDGSFELGQSQLLSGLKVSVHFHQ